MARIVHVASVHFAPSGSNLRRGARAKLTSLRRHLGGVRTVRCVGNTDDRGTAAADEILGLKRAVVTCAYITRHRHASSRVRSDGKTNPVAPNTTADGRRKNRRTDITLTY